MLVVSLYMNHIARQINFFIHKRRKKMTDRHTSKYHNGRTGETILAVNNAMHMTTNNWP